MNIDQFKQAISILEEMKEELRNKRDPISIGIYEQCLEKIVEFNISIRSIAQSEANKVIHEKLKFIFSREIK